MGFETDNGLITGRRGNDMDDTLADHEAPHNRTGNAGAGWVERVKQLFRGVADRESRQLAANRCTAPG